NNGQSTSSQPNSTVYGSGYGSASQQPLNQTGAISSNQFAPPQNNGQSTSSQPNTTVYGSGYGSASQQPLNQTGAISNNPNLYSNLGTGVGALSAGIAGMAISNSGQPSSTNTQAPPAPPARPANSSPSANPAPPAPPFPASSYNIFASASTAAGYNTLPLAGSSASVPRAIYGPVVQFINTDLVNIQWVGTMLVVTDSSLYNHSIGPCIHIWNSEASVSDLSAADKYTAQLLFDDTQNGFKFWTINMRFPIPPNNEKTMFYRAIPNEGEKSIQSPLFKFTIPSQRTTWRWCSFSNDDISYSSSTIIRQANIEESLWHDILEKHNTNPFHAMLGMGGQINGDDLWSDLGSMDQSFASQPTQPYSPINAGQNNCGYAPLALFVGIKVEGKMEFISDDSRSRIPWTPEMELAVSKWYFARYMKRWFNSEKHGYVSQSSSPNFASALNSIPSMFCLDENDIFPGYGSYSDILMRSPVFKGIYSVAMKYWSLFQAHTEWEMIKNNSVKDNPFISAMGVHWIRSLGPFTSVLGLDAISEKSKVFVITNTAYDDIFRGIGKRVRNLTQHLVICSPVPIVYPHSMYMDNILSGAKSIGAMDAFNYAYRKSSHSYYTMPQPNNPMYQQSATKTFEDFLKSKSVDSLGESRLLMDIYSLWTSESHIKERGYFIQRLQWLTNDNKGLRVSFLSGHVNCAGSGYLAARNLDEAYFDPNQYSSIDNRYMAQVFSASTSDLPADSVVVKALYMAGKSRSFDLYTVERLNRLFEVDVDGKPPSSGNRKIMGRRSYITMEEIFDYQSSSNSSNSNAAPVVSLRANLCIEKNPYKEQLFPQGAPTNYYSPAIQTQTASTQSYKIDIRALQMNDPKFFQKSTRPFPQANTAGAYYPNQQIPGSFNPIRYYPQSYGYYQPSYTSLNTQYATSPGITQPPASATQQPPTQPQYGQATAGSTIPNQFDINDKPPPYTP
ncbi:hypothetical protein BB560_005761, partial [Smittium megazygosporum]